MPRDNKSINPNLGTRSMFAYCKHTTWPLRPAHFESAKLSKSFARPIGVPTLLRSVE